ILFAEVVASVEDYEGTDAENECAEQEGESVQANVQVQPDNGYPGHLPAWHFPSAHGGPMAGQEGEAGEGDRQCDRSSNAPASAYQQRRKQGTQERQNYRKRQSHAARAISCKRASRRLPAVVGSMWARSASAPPG